MEEDAMAAKPQRKVLVVDDEAHTLEMIKSRLEANGYQVRTASHGEEGLSLVREEHPDLIILDVLMPVMDGFQFLKELKKDESLSSIPVMMLTARGAMKDTFEAMDVDAFLVKPFEPEDLLSSIESLFRKKALILTGNPTNVEKVVKALEKHEYEIHFAPNEGEFWEKATGTKYKIAVVHIAYVEKEPAEFVRGITRFRYKNPSVILFSDVHVKGTEDNNTASIDEIRVEWDRAGLKKFYDRRTAGIPFVDALKNLVT